MLLQKIFVKVFVTFFVKVFFGLFATRSLMSLKILV